jgi:hypothetical protein
MSPTPAIPSYLCQTRSWGDKSQKSIAVGGVPPVNAALIAFHYLSAKIIERLQSGGFHEAAIGQGMTNARDFDGSGAEYGNLHLRQLRRLACVLKHLGASIVIRLTAEALPGTEKVLHEAIARVIMRLPASNQYRWKQILPILFSTWRPFGTAEA